MLQVSQPINLMFPLSSDIFCREPYLSGINSCTRAEVGDSKRLHNFILFVKINSRSLPSKRLRKQGEVKKTNGSFKRDRGLTEADA